MTCLITSQSLPIYLSKGLPFNSYLRLVLWHTPCSIPEYENTIYASHPGNRNSFC